MKLWKTTSYAALVVCGLLGGCALETHDGEADQTAAAKEPIINGTIVPTDALGSPRLYLRAGGHCSSTLINSTWILTAHHCLTNELVVTGGTPMDPATVTAGLLNGSSAQGKTIILHPTLDVALLQLKAPLLKAGNNEYLNAMYLGTSDSLVGSNVYCQGWGRNTVAGDEGTLRSTSLAVKFPEANGFRLLADPATGQVPWEGDSGSAAFSSTSGIIAGVSSVSHQDSVTFKVTGATYVGAESFRGWVSSVVGTDNSRRVEGDFNGDGRKDVIVVTDLGSFEYLGQAGGGFAGAWSSSSLKLGTVQYVPGDFNGDGRTDLIIVTAWGSFEYLGTNSGFTPDVWVRSNLNFGNVQYFPGDFDGDHKQDLIIVTSGGSYEYLGLSVGGFLSSVWSKDYLSLGNTDYAQGDFNGDGKSDLIVVTSAGSFEYLGKSGGGFTTNVWTSSYLTLGQVSYTVADYNGDTKADLIITTASGSFEYTGLSGGGFTPDAWSRTDLPRGSVHYAPGDFNGDGKGDLMITTASGSFEYLGAAAGGFSSPWGNTALTMNNTQFAVGDYTGDGRSDLIIVTPSGSFEYTGLAAGAFTPNVWTRGDLSLGNVRYWP